MILTYQKILESVNNGRICISPFDEAMLNSNSYDYRIDRKLLEIDDIPVDPKKQTSYHEIEFNDDGYVLSPNKTYLANTYEEIGSKEFVPLLIGKSSLGRLGLFLQITADLGNDPTFAGNDHTRENVPVILYSKNIKKPSRMDPFQTMANIGATIADNFDIDQPEIGESILDKLD